MAYILPAFCVMNASSPSTSWADGDARPSPFMMIPFVAFYGRRVVMGKNPSLLFLAREFPGKASARVPVRHEE
jgi:hypothetical protein